MLKMKKLSILILTITSLLLASSCDTVYKLPIAQLIAPQKLSSLTASNFVLTKIDAASNFQTFSWSAANFDFRAAVTYTVQLDKASNNFENPIQLGTTSGLSLKVSVEQMNTFLTQLGAFPNTPADYKIRVTGVADSQIETAVSSAKNFTASIYDPSAPNYDFLYVAENYPNWNWQTAPKLGSPNNDGFYVSFIDFPGVSKNVKFRLVDGTDLTKTYGQGMDLNGADFDFTGTGYFRFEADVTNASFNTTVTDWGIIGSATAGGWGSDQNMTYDSNNHVWKAVLDLTSGQIKFRANDAWDINLGDNGADGTLEYGGANIDITSPGSYTIILDLESAPGIFTYTLSKAEVAPSSPTLFLPGGYQGWDPASAPTITSLNLDGFYTGYVYIKEATEFKFTNKPNWNNKTFGDSGDGTTGILASPGNNIKIPAAGYYLFTVDTNGSKWAALDTNWGLIGSATPDGWNSDQNMTYDPVSDTWSITIDLVAGEIKFRANDAWDLNYGDTGADGTLNQGGDNIAIATAGNYTIVLNLSDDSNYTYTITKN